MKAATTAALLLVAAFAVVLAWLPAYGAETSDYGTLGIGAVAAGACLLASRRQPDRRRRRGLLLLMGAVLAWTAGEGAWTVYELALGQATPFPSWADAGFLLAIPFAAGAMFALGPPLERTTRLRVAVDGLIIACCTLFIGWAFVLGPVYRASASTDTALVALAYPIGDILVLAALLHAAARAPRSERSLWWLLALGIAGWTVSDSAFAFTTANETYVSGLWVDVGWFAAFAFIGAAAASQMQPAPADPASAAPRPGWMLPMALSILATAVAAGLELWNHDLEEVLVWVGLAFVGLVLGRQALAQAEVRRIERRAMAAESLHDRMRFQSRFLNAAAHEMATPLTPLRMDVHRLATDLRQRDRPDAAARLDQTVAGIQRQVDRLVRVVDDLSHAANLHDGGFDLRPRASDLAVVVRETLEAERPAAARGGVHVEAAVPPALEALVDPGAMAEALRRMVAFALARCQGGGTVRVELLAVGAAARLAVQDSHPVEDPLLLQDLFAGLGNSSAGMPGGGLGLHVSHGIIQRHGGTLTASDTAVGLALVALVPLRADPRAPAPDAPDTGFPDAPAPKA